jgi:hypothetical protein
VFLKIIYFSTAISYRICEVFKIDEKKITYLKTLRDNTLIVSEFFMYIIIVVLFFPRQKPKDIHIGREEQLIIFMLGLLGLIHTNWDTFKKFFIDIKLIPKNI